MLGNFLSMFLISFKKLNSSLKYIGGIKLWITVICITFIAISISNNFVKLSQLSLDRNSLILLFLGLFASWLSLVINAFAWRAIIAWLGYKDLALDLVSLFLASNLMKYLPGGIWHFVERIRFLRNHINLEKSFLSVLIEPFFMIMAALFWILFGDFKLSLKILCVIPFLLFTAPFREILVIQLNKLKKSLFDKTSNRISIDSFELKANTLNNSYPLLPIFIEIVFIAFRFFGFWLCLSAFSLENNFSILQWLSFFSFAWLAGLLVPSAPGGVGVFETSLLLVIGSNIPEEGLISALLFYRLIVSLADIIAAIPAHFLLKKQQLPYS